MNVYPPSLEKESVGILKIIGMLLFICCATISGIAQEGIEEDGKEEVFEHHCHFEERSLTVGLGAPYSIEIESVGVNLRMYYNIGEKICFGPEYSYFKNDAFEIVDFDFIGHYIFETKFAGIYPLLGVNYTVETERELIEEVKESAGAVYGIGMHRNFSDITFFVEYSRVESGIDDQFITGGIMYSLR